MPTPSKGPRLGGSPAHERLMLANLASQLFTHEQITTTEHRAKRLRPYAEKLITLAKRGDTHSRRRVLRDITDRGVVAVLFEETAPKFAERDGGYTRITRVGNRKGDNAPMAVISLVLEPVSPKQAVVKEATKATARSAAAPSAAPAAKVEDPETNEEATVTEQNATDAPVEDAQPAQKPAAADDAESAADPGTESKTVDGPAEETEVAVEPEADDDNPAKA